MNKPNSLLSTTPGRCKKTLSKNSSVFWRNWDSKTLVFLEFSHKLSEFPHNHIFGLCCDITPFKNFNNRIFRVVLIWDVVAKSNCHLIHEYPISKQIINIMISGSIIILGQQEYRSKLCPVLLVTLLYYQKDQENSLKRHQYD